MHLHALLRRQMADRMRIRRPARHTLPATRHPLARLARHAHSPATRVLAAGHGAHGPAVRATGLHAHHRARLADVRLARPGHAGVLHHGLAHVLCGVGRHARVAVGGHAHRVHARLGLVCGHHSCWLSVVSCARGELSVKRFRRSVG